MIAKTLLAAFLVNSVACVTNSTTNGVSASFDIAVLEQAKDIYFDKLLSLINTIPIPDFVQDKNDYLKDNSFVLNQDAKNVEFTVDTAKNALVLTCSDLSATFVTKDFRMKEFIFIATGTAEVDLEKIKIALGVEFTTQTLADGRVVPAVNAVDVIVDIDRNDLKFHIHGNVWTDMASVFEPLFKGAILDAVTSAVNQALSTTAPTVANSFIAKTDGMSQIIPNLFLDWMTAQSFIVTETSLEFGARAILYDSVFGETVPSFPEMPYKDINQSAGIQVFLADESVNAAFKALLEVHPVEFWLNATEIPASAPFQLTTGYLDKVFSGMSSYYGPNQTVNVFVNVTDIYDWTITEGNQEANLNGDMTLRFYVDTVNGTTDLAVDVSLNKMIAQATILVEGFNITGNFTKLKVQNVLVNSCEFGSPSTFKIKMELNVALAVAAEPINKKLSTLVIPSSVLGIFELSDLYLGYYDGFLFAGATPTFLPPTMGIVEYVHAFAYAVANAPDFSLTE